MNIAIGIIDIAKDTKKFCTRPKLKRVYRFQIPEEDRPELIALYKKLSKGRKITHKRHEIDLVCDRYRITRNTAKRAIQDMLDGKK